MTQVMPTRDELRGEAAASGEKARSGFRIDGLGR
jgi:hypothetical protein